MVLDLVLLPSGSGRDQDPHMLTRQSIGTVNMTVRWGLIQEAHKTLKMEEKRVFNTEKGRTRNREVIGSKACIPFSIILSTICVYICYKRRVVQFVLF